MMIEKARGEQPPLVVYSCQAEANSEHPDDERAEDGANDGSSAAEEAGTADHHSRNAVEVGVDYRVGACGSRSSNLHPGRDAVDQTGDGVDTQQHPVDPDADQPGRLDIISNGVDVSPPGCLAEDERA